MSMKIYFDMDGVLADFDVSAAGYSDTNINLNNSSLNLSGDACDAKRRRWQRIEMDKNFWRDIPVVPGIEKLLDTARGIGEMFVLTSVPGAKNFVGGAAYVDFIEQEKREWIKHYFGQYFSDKNVIVARIPKEQLIRPTQNDILIDDRTGNVDGWCAAGGRGIVFTTAPHATGCLGMMASDFVEQ